MAATVSVVIPALNEARWVSTSISRIRQEIDPAEIVLVDNGSSDGTQELAQAAGAMVVQTGGTVAAMRNLGARLTTGEVLVFIDADVWLRPGYGGALRRVIEDFAEHPQTLAGAVVGIPDDPTWLQAAWADPRIQRMAHLGSANMVIGRAFFERLGGFNERLPTGEDTDLCERVERAGGEVRFVPELVTAHQGWPRTLREFVRREAWQGGGDWVSLRAVVRSIIALLTIAFVAAHLVVVAGLLVEPWLAAAGAAAILGLCALMLVRKSLRAPLKYWPGLLVVWYCYFVGRAWSAMRVLSGREHRLARPAVHTRAGA